MKKDANASHGVRVVVSMRSKRHREELRNKREMLARFNRAQRLMRAGQ